MKTLLRPLRAALLWFWWLISPLSQRHDFHANPVIGSPILNRLGLHVLRLVLARAVMRLRWLLLSPFMDTPLRQAFHRDGYTVIDDVLPAEEFIRLREEVARAHGEFRQCIQGDTLTQRLFLDDDVLRQLPCLASFLNQPRITKALRYAAAKNCRPLQYIQQIRNGAQPGGDDPQKNLHSDTFHSSMKAWFFLDQVSAENGPFCYVPGSNRLSLARIGWEYRRSIAAASLNDGYSEKGSFRFGPEDLRHLGLPVARAMCVAANTLIIADTFGIHARGQAAPGSRRLEIWAYSRFNPFNPWPGLGLPFYSRADYALHRWWWRHMDKRAAARGQLSSWHPVSEQAFHRGWSPPGLADSPSEADAINN